MMGHFQDGYFTFFLLISGVVGTVLLYYAVSLQNLNSAQIERLLKIKRKPPQFRGLPVTTFILSLRVAALVCELLIVLGVAVKLFSQAWNWIDIVLFIGICLFFVVLGRMYLPLGFPLHERESLNSLEESILLLFGYLFFPLAFVMQKMTSKTASSLFPKTEDERISQAEETIKSMIDVGEVQGIFRKDEGELLQSIVEFSETIVREVMTPRIDLQAIEITESFEVAVRLAVESNYSKIPAYRERIDNIEGILYAKELLKYWNSDHSKVKLEDITRPAFFVPETKKVRSLLRELQKEKIHMAIVVDEYGGVAGVITLEDLLEEIVGEIHDEYDDEEEMIKTIGENAYFADARVDLEELGDILKLEFPEENYETLGGFLFDQMGRVPVAGETLRYQNLLMEIKEADERRILKVIIRKESVKEEPKPEEEDFKND